MIDVETNAQIAAIHLKHITISAGKQMQLGVVGFPLGGSALIEEIAAYEESIAQAADPCAAWGDVDVVEKIVGGIGDECSMYGVGAGEGDGGARGFENAVVGDVAGEDGGAVGDADLFSCGVGDIAVDGGSAAAEGHGAVVGELRRAESSVAGNLAGATEREIVVIKRAAGEVDDAGVGGQAAAHQHLVSGGCGDGAGVVDDAAENQRAADGFDGAIVVHVAADCAAALDCPGAGDFAADQARTDAGDLNDSS